MKPEESSVTRYRFRVTGEPGKTEKFTVEERRPGGGLMSKGEETASN